MQARAGTSSYLINTGTHLVLVDAGAAALFGPGIGHLRADGKGYVFVPANYTPIK